MENLLLKLCIICVVGGSSALIFGMIKIIINDVINDAIKEIKKNGGISGFLKDDAIVVIGSLFVIGGVVSLILLLLFSLI